MTRPLATVDGGLLRGPRFHRRLAAEAAVTLAVIADDWREPYYTAIREITWTVQTGGAWCLIFLPFPFEVQARRKSEEVLNLAVKHGFSLRPGGPAGYAGDIIRLDRSDSFVADGGEGYEEVA